jgi:predicted secreted hydrolase
VTRLRSGRIAAGLLGVGGLALGLWGWLAGPPAGRPPVRASLALHEVLGGSAASGFARAEGPRRFAFPADHGPHPDFRTEWWYWTGNLATAAGRHVGVQLTLFRTALVARPPSRGSAWGTRDVYLGHFAVTDTGGRRFHAAERFARGALGLAGAEADPFRVWLEDWSVEAAGAGMRLRAATVGVAVDLVLESDKPPALHGLGGLSRKSAEPGNASYYYSLPRIRARGTVRLGAERLGVEGLAWMDREWSTSALAVDQVGWDWFALQLTDGRELMLYQLRRRDGAVDPASAGSLIQADGTVRTLQPEAFTVDPRAVWVSPRGGTRYPARWRLRVPAAGLDLEVTPVLADQELDLAVRYWEGAVRVRGTTDGRPVAGRGYVELTGYASPPGPGVEAEGRR